MYYTNPDNIQDGKQGPDTASFEDFYTKPKTQSKELRKCNKWIFGMTCFGIFTTITILILVSALSKDKAIAPTTTTMTTTAIPITTTTPTTQRPKPPTAPVVIEDTTTTSTTTTTTRTTTSSTKEVTTTTTPPTTSTRATTTSTRTTTTTTSPTTATPMTTTKPATTTTSAALRQKRLVRNPYPYYYFPTESERAVLYDQAKAECEYIEGYTVARVEHTNPNYLASTADVVKNSNAEALWVGAWLDYDNGNATTIFWADGRVTDSTKAPLGVFCMGYGVPAQTASYKRYSELGVMKGTRIPFVRIKENPHCLTMEYDRFKTLPAFCTLARSSLSVKNSNGKSIVPPFYINPTGPLFNETHQAITEMRRRVGCTYPGNTPCIGEESSNTYSNIIPVRPLRVFVILDSTPYRYYPAGFAQYVDYDTAEAVCMATRNAFEQAPGQLMTYTLLNKRLDNPYVNANDTIRESFMTSFLRLPSLPVEERLFVTGGVFDFLPSANVSYDRLIWKIDGQRRMADSYDINIPWCSGSHPSTVIPQLYAQFKEFYANIKETNGVHRVHVVVTGVSACLKLVTEDLFWPGYTNFIPSCQLYRP